MSEYQLPENFKPISLQDIFSAAWQAFIVEGRPPAVMGRAGRITCCYLTEDGRKCAVGLCIPDGHPAQYERARFWVIVGGYPDLWDASIFGMDSEEVDLFQKWLHDDHVSHDTGGWDASLDDRRDTYRHIARVYGLTIPGGSDDQG